MIKNERQYRITKTRAETFRAALAARAAKRSPEDPALRAWKTDALRAQLGDLERDLRDYETLQDMAGQRDLIGASIGALLIQARIARGWTQRELGARVGLHHQQIADYESREYDRSSLARIGEIWQALGAKVTVHVHLVDLPQVDLAAPVAAVADTAPRS